MTTPRGGRDVWFVIEGLRGGGAERVVSRLLQRWRPEDQLTLVTFLPIEDAYPVPDSVRRLRIAVPRYIPRRVSPAWVLATLSVRLLLQRPDAVLSFLPRANAVNALSRLLPFRSHRAIISERNSIDSRPRPQQRRMRLLRRYVYRWADRIVAVSEGVGRELVEGGLPREQIIAIPNFVDIPELRALAAAGVLGPPRAHHIVFVGRLEPQKGVDVLLRAMKLVVRRVPDAHLTVIGQGSQLQLLRRLIDALGVAPHVTLEGEFNSNPFATVAAAAVFVLPSRAEGFPNALLEAMSLNVACVATDCHWGPSELVVSGENGLLVPPENAAALAEALISLLTNDALRRQIAKRAGDTARMHSPERLVERWTHVVDTTA